MNDSKDPVKVPSLGTSYSALKRVIKGRAYQITHLLQSNQMKLSAMEAEVKIFEEQVSDEELRIIVRDKMHGLRLQVAAQVDRSVDEIDQICKLCIKLNGLVIQQIPAKHRAQFFVDPVIIMGEASELAKQILQTTQRQ
jgi:hypothetical protein